MTTATELDVGDIIERISDEDKARRIEFVESCPPCRPIETAVIAAGMDLEEMRPQAIDFLASSYAQDGPYDAAERFGEATYCLARSMFERGSGDLDTCRMIAGRGALSWMTGLKQLGCHEKLLHEIEEPISWLESVNDSDTLDMLRLKRVEVELDLQRYDAAERHLAEIREEILPPMVQVTYRALKAWLDRMKGGGTELPGEGPPQSSKRLMEIFSGNLATDQGSTITAEEGAALGRVSKDIIDRLFGGRRGAVNEFTVRQKLTDASYLFTDPAKGRDPIEIAKVVPVLVYCRDWMRAHNFADSENDACWSLYLCYSRTNRPALAAKELQRLRTNIERTRSAVADPSERARLSARYPYLYPCLAGLLHTLEDPSGLFEAVEASKGRMLADLQTQRRGVPASESEFSQAVRALPILLKGTGAAYLTYLVDEEVTFAVVVDCRGGLSMYRIELGANILSRLAAMGDPRQWGKRDPATLQRIPNVAAELAPLVRCLQHISTDPETRHLCYSPSGPLLSLPLHCAMFDGAPLLERFSVSRIHGAASLFHLLSDEPASPAEFVSVEVPAIQDLGNPAKIEALGEPGKWLERNLSRGSRLEGEAGSVSALEKHATHDKIIHFATHGTFPEKPDPARDPNPFRSSGLLLSRDGELPDLNAPLGGSLHLLSPERIVELGLDFRGSHVTLTACVTGLAKSSIGGDALGLEFALLQLGARSILSTHWNADARAMARFLVAFYSRWIKENQSQGSAWRETVLELLEANGGTDEGAYYGAAFSLTGDWR